MSSINPNEDARILRNRRDAQAAFTPGGDASNPSPEEIESEIRHTRAQMDGTLSELQRKLSSKPNEVLEEFVENLSQAVVRNPVPTVLLGAGLLWIMGSFLIRHRVPVALVGSAVAWRKMYGPEEGRHARPRQVETEPQRGLELGEPEQGGRMAESGRRMIDTLKERADLGRERLSERSAHMRSQLAGAADSARARASQLAETTRERAERLRSSTQSMVNEQPLVLAMLGLAAGAMLGALLPQTRREDELMGETRDRMMERGREQMHEQMERGKEAAKAVAEAATDAAKEEAGRQRETMSGRDSRPPSAQPRPESGPGTVQ